MSPPPKYAEHVGRTAPSRVVLVESGHIMRFANAIGDTNPIYRDDDAARAHGYEKIPAPPTFATALRPNDPRDGLDIDWTKLLHAQQEFEYDRPIYAGDRLTLYARISEAFVKEGKSGTLDFLIVETKATDESGNPVFTARSTVAIRR